MRTSTARDRPRHAPPPRRRYVGLPRRPWANAAGRLRTDSRCGVNFTVSAFPPLALGYFGLGTGYLMWGPQELLGWPKRGERADRALGVWGIWLPGFCQFISGIVLIIGLTWFQVFKAPPEYMAALAFSAYGIHWFALGWNRCQGNDHRPNAGMTIAYMLISAMGASVFFAVGDWPVGVLVGLFAVYFCHFFTTIGVGAAERVLGLVRILTGAWLMYLTYAVVVNLCLGYHWPVRHEPVAAGERPRQPTRRVLRAVKRIRLRQ
ncbi:hypothetical protein [Streptomyces sp. NPDC093676]|uniref:hypothetical protein n=1 Tax=Streptomyces sp. NPDC093676 TaxID=3366050 RepID=UPI00381CBB68